MARLNKTPLTIRAKRGTEAQITATSPAPYQKEGEIAYATDTKQLYISDGTKFNSVTLIANGTTTGQLLFWDGSQWTYINASDLFWDNTNKRFGIGTNNPDRKLTIYQDSDTSGIILYGYDDRSTRYHEMYINEWGNLLFRNNGGSVYFQGLSVLSSYDFKIGGTGSMNYRWLKDDITDNNIRFYTNNSDGLGTDLDIFRIKDHTSDLAIMPDGGRTGIGTDSPNSTVHNAGSLSLSYTEKTADYTLTENDYTVNCTANTFTITLPTAVGITGRIYNIKNSGTGVITVEGDGIETIDGELNQTLYEKDSICVQSTGTNWIII